MSEVFEGFIQPKKNYFQMPNAWIDISASITNLAELKVVQYVLRHTWGYREYGIAKAISVDEFMHGRKYADGSRMDKGTGLSNHSVIDGLKAAIKHGYLVCEVDTSDLARVKKSYSLKMSSPPEDTTPGEDVAPPEDTTPQMCRTFTPGVKNLHSGGEESSHRSEKDTLERHLEKDTLERQGGNVASADANPPAPVISQQLNGEENDGPDNAGGNHPDRGHSGTHAEPAEHQAGQGEPGSAQALATTRRADSEPARRSGSPERQDNRTAPEKPVSFTQSGAGSPQASAKVETRNPAQGRKGANQYTVYLCTEGQAFRGWYENIAGFELDDTAANAAALNKLGKKRGMTEEKLRKVLEKISGDTWLSSRNIPVTIQDLASDTHIYRLEHWTQLLAQSVTTAKPVTSPTDDLYSIESLLARQQSPIRLEAL